MHFDGFLQHLSRDTALEKSDLRAAFYLIKENLSNLLADGYVVHTPIGKFKPGIQGSLDKETDAFLPHKEGSGHSMHITYLADKELRKDTLSRARFIRTAGKGIPAPRITDTANLSRNQAHSFIPGDVIEIKGSNLKCNTDQENEGIFLQNEQGDRLRINRFIIESNNRYVSIIPEIPDGMYSVAIRKSRGKANSFTSIFPDKITVLHQPDRN